MRVVHGQLLETHLKFVKIDFLFQFHWCVHKQLFHSASCAFSSHMRLHCYHKDFVFSARLGLWNPVDLKILFSMNLLFSFFIPAVLGSKHLSDFKSLPLKSKVYHKNIHFDRNNKFLCWCFYLHGFLKGIQFSSLFLLKIIF